MALNQKTLADEDGDFSDWIELYNPTPISSKSVDLQSLSSASLSEAETCAENPKSL